MEAKERFPRTPSKKAEYILRNINMCTITTHAVTLEKKLDQGNLRLIPLCDEHLPYLYRWNSDTDVLYWTEADDVIEPYSPETVRAIYGGVSKNAFCFLAQLDDKPIGECWLQRMNLPKVRSLYPETCDVRRIDLCIGEKEYWGKGIGTEMLALLVRFAFEQEKVDVLRCFSEDYNLRSRRAFEKNGFSLVLSEPVSTPSQKRNVEYHWELTKEDFLSFSG